MRCPRRCARRNAQAVQALLLSLVTVGGSPKVHHCSLLIPTLRLDEALMSKVTGACSRWVHAGHQPLAALTIVGCFTSPCNSADLPAARASCTTLRAQPYFASLLKHSLGQVGQQGAAAVLGRFWDAVLGTPPQSVVDAAILGESLSGLAGATELRSSLDILLAGMNARATEANPAARYGGCAPLLRITSSLLQCPTLVEYFHASGLVNVMVSLLKAVLALASSSMGAEGGSGSMQDLLAAMALEVSTVAITQPSLAWMFKLSDRPAEGPPPEEPALKAPLELVVRAAVERLSAPSPIGPLPRLLEALRRLYGGLQKHGGSSMIQLLQGVCTGDDSAKDSADKVNAHLVILAKPTNRLEDWNAAPPPGLLKAGLPEINTAELATTRSYRNAYPILPPAQPFSIVPSSIVSREILGKAPTMGLKEAPQPLRAALLERRWAELTLARSGRQLMVSSPVPAGHLIIEYCGEVVEGGDAMVGALSSYSTIWPPQLCMLRLCPAALFLDISRCSSVARFAEHAEHASCELQAWVLDGRPVLSIVGKRDLARGDVVTVDYTSFSLGARIEPRLAP